MWQNIVNIVQSAGAFLSNDKAPPNTPARLEQQLEDTNHLASKKFFVIFSAAIALITIYFASVGILFFIPRTPELIVSYTTIFSKMMEIFAVIVATYLGAQGIVDLKYNSSSNVSLEGEVEVYEEILTNNTKEDDYHISEVEV